MGRIVSAAATSHTLGPPDGIEERADRVFDGMLAIGRHIRESRPDLVVVVASDHLQNFRLDRQIPFAIGLSDTFTPLGDLGIPQQPFPGHRDFAAGLLAYAAERDYDLVGAEGIRPDHGVALPATVVNRDAALPVVPLYINSVMSPPPSCRRAYGLGKVIRDYVAAARPGSERVAVLGSGGLSHWLCVPGEGNVNSAWDRRIMQQVVAGRAAGLAALTRDDILAEGGNGGLEIAAWLCMAGAVEGAAGDEVYYEAMPEWWTGMGGVTMRVA
jgi:protocatechuate 4,5-dioxygenase beta chain/2'-aminobiphenyl-2,3-diol 1,2-dioxygenase large subunit